MLRDVLNISNAFAKEGFDPPICNRIRNVNSNSMMDSQNGKLDSVEKIVWLVCVCTVALEKKHQSSCT
jgi:hypothetical protein